MEEQNNQKIIDLKYKSALIQTDFSNQQTWEDLVVTVKEGDGLNRPDLNYISDPKLNLVNDQINIYDDVIAGSIICCDNIDY